MFIEMHQLICSSPRQKMPTMCTVWCDVLKKVLSSFKSRVWLFLLRGWIYATQ